MSKQPQAEPGPSRDDCELAERLAQFSSRSATPDEAIALFDEARSRCPVAHSDQLGGFDMLLRYDDVKSAATNWRTFSSSPSAVRPLKNLPRQLAIDWDPPEHTAWRALVKLAIDHTTAGRIEQRIREDVDGLIDGFADRGECDLVTEFSEELTFGTLCHVLDFEAEARAELRRLSRELITARGRPEQQGRAYQAIEAFTVPYVLSFRGQSSDRFPAKLANAEMDGHLVTEDEIGTVMIGLLAAGYETTASGLSSLLYEVLAQPDVRDRLASDPDLVPVAVEEALRVHPPVFGFYRRITEPVTVADTELDGTAYLSWVAANRDPQAFDEPDAFRLDRVRPKRHLAFGFGLHACPGAPIARVEMAVALTGILRRLPDLSLVDAAAVRHVFKGNESVKIRSLPARFTPPNGRDDRARADGARSTAAHD